MSAITPVKKSPCFIYSILFTPLKPAKAGSSLAEQATAQAASRPPLFIRQKLDTLNRGKILGAAMTGMQTKARKQNLVNTTALNRALH
ncbi:MAG TPA: hypothetical protein PK129_07860 [Cellvibrionaceae bacterium]|nr:hypothetical protein [Cellvibrionaceae bacterium]